MEKIIEFFSTPLGISIASIVASIILILLSLLFKFIASKISNTKIKKLFTIASDACIYAEKLGGSASEKYENAVEYIKNNLSASNSDIDNAIETIMNATFVVNSKSSYKSISSSTSRSTRDK